VFDAEGRFVFASPASERIWGYRPEELLGTPYLEKVVAEDRPRSLETAAAVMAGAVILDFRNRYERKDGTVAHVMWTARWSAEEGRMFCIARDVTESERLREEARRHLETLTRTAAELERARAKAESADRLKSAFLATMSHELRTPLNSIIGFTGVLLQELPGPLNDEQRKQLGIVVAGARHLLALINDVLDISKIEAGQLAVAREDFDFAAVVAKAAAAVRPLAEQKGLAFAVRLGDGLGTVSGDARRVEQVLLNLLGNAVKFTEQGAITLSAEPIASFRPGEATSACSAVRASVADSGPGIRPGDLARLFRPFEQVAGGLSRAHEGTGLGLAISRRLAELMGGTIEVDSRWQEGSTFTFTIPRAPEANP
jgi:PAS domain S-box-containing protein